MRRLTAWTLAALPAVLLGAAAPADAATRSFLDFCSSGAIRTCASIQVTTQARSTGGTQVWIRVRNLQGTLAADNTGGSLITRLGLTHPGIEGADNFTVATEGGAVRVMDGTPWEIDAPVAFVPPKEDASIGGSVTFSISSKGGVDGIMGCDPAGNTGKDHFQTCGDPGVAGDEGWVVFGFTTTNAWDAADSEVAWQVSAEAADGGSYTCRTGEDCAATATPEPATALLLGSGLAGLGYLRRRRERSED